MSELKQTLGHIDVLLRHQTYTSYEKAGRITEVIAPIAKDYRILGIIQQVLLSYKTSTEKIGRIQEVLKIEDMDAVWAE